MSTILFYACVVFAVGSIVLLCCGMGVPASIVGAVAFGCFVLGVAFACLEVSDARDSD